MNIEEIVKLHGKEAIFLVGDGSYQLDVPVIPTGSLALDIALGVGGIPRGRVTEIYGPESSGKTTICQHLIAQTQKLGGEVCFVDAEQALDPTWAETCGVDLSKLYLAQPTTAEEALSIVELALGEADLVVVDSVAALAPKAEVDGEPGDRHMALVARLMAQAFRRMMSKVKKSNTAVVFTNQLRSKIGVVFGNPNVTTGGNALKFFASIRIELRKKAASEDIKSGDDILGIRVKAVVRKNKVAIPYKICEIPILFDEGISRFVELIDYGQEEGYITKEGSWYTVGEDEKAQGNANLRKLMAEKPELLQQIEDKIRVDNGLPIWREAVK